GRELLARAELANRPSRGPLTDPAARRAVYPEGRPISVSRLECFGSCRFEHFVRYGLGVREEVRADLEPRIIGTFVHYVVEQMAREITARPGDPWGCLDPSDARAVAKKYVDEYARTQLGGLDDKPARIRWLFRNLESRVYAVAESLAAEFRVSEFRPAWFEYEFLGRDVRVGDRTFPLTGKVDRVDLWEKDGKTYLRVVDYKTGEKKFDYSEVSAGLGLQMLVYLFVLENELSASPAGVLYVPSFRKVKKVGADAAPPEDEGRTGVLLSDRAVLGAMEAVAPGAKHARFIPVGFARDGSLSRNSALVTEEELGILKRRVTAALDSMQSALAGGEIECDPYLKSGGSACDRCGYRQICQFDTGRRSDAYRLVKRVKREAFFGEEETRA
ncbi:MAG: PD-(D/E)XK nuclease family protein, partial [Oscillospiraceae bacterium]|nr:PD-(D/E)XK nuclease family protein [Oscillospiraceae bacterium]